jgi:hypothetical protein
LYISWAHVYIMKVKVPPEIKDKYKVPPVMTNFQLALYLHLIEWKWKNLTKVPGKYKGIEYDVILPDEFKKNHYPLYQPIVSELAKHQFKLHKHFGHMASSQAACLNLFIPILRNNKTANLILPKINPYFKELAIDLLEGGFKFEFFDQDNPLNDHTDAAGTDSDIAITYYDTSGLLCLWLIEHKLTENEFTTCGGYRSKGNKKKIDCKNGQLILADHSKCYYTYNCGYKYWEITQRSNLYNFEKLKNKDHCPFIGGENQLWRNQLLSYSIQEKGLFKKVHFSVVHHHENHDLGHTIAMYKQILNDSNIFGSFTSKDLINAAKSINDKSIKEWLDWFSGLYMI